ncbi:hypothetical protein TREPR_2643 [Treponema primitia ZAS-2]|uniref:Uncharacterized protein n=1 Tax=Treponema primitia (strain ATCC BAA-887 / DSM 12427 / ZAS-2) TaxID=545694 RepID=F5YR89_TREPZ|nr:hypothetical protein [Treponema primitia]AEF86708.1 hypothetical protein TREPR_2643 [Treponema primitia ZAS-2]
MGHCLCGKLRCTKRPTGRVYLAAMLFFTLFFASCVGVHSDITIRKDGSGTIALEYRLSRELESLGKLDGNQGWLPLPVGKADFERTVARVQGLSLGSFNTKITGQDSITQVKLNFTNLDALARFLDSTGQGVSLVREGEKTRMTLGFSGAAGAQNRELMTLVSEAMESYTLDFGLTLPNEAELRILGENGQVLSAPPAGTLMVQGSRIVYSSPMAELLSSPGRVVLDILW